ncbi:hypothetical protein ASG41_07310 [Modestobacter sp. Leaf380]|nr:hypothetical protein ASG41_07310 [Modestobacter sp. Leaf380]
MASFVAVYLGRFLTANVRVAGQVLRPRLTLEPVVVDHRLRCRTDAEVASFVALVGLTPGSLVVDRRDGVLTVHAMHATDPADELASLRDLEDRMLTAWRGTGGDA